MGSGCIGGTRLLGYVAATWFSAMETMFVLAVGATMAIALVRGLSES